MLCYRRVCVDISILCCLLGTLAIASYPPGMLLATLCDCCPLDCRVWLQGAIATRGEGLYEGLDWCVGAAVHSWVAAVAGGNMGIAARCFGALLV